MFPSEFIEAFEAQYPKPELKYELPSSLDRCPSLKGLIERNIFSNHELKLVVIDENNVMYDMIGRTYTTPSSAVKHKMTTQGYDTVFEKLYKQHGENLSPKTFSFIIEDLVALNPIKFRAELVTGLSGYLIRKAIELNKAWIDYCSNYETNFKMNYTEYEKLIGLSKQ